MKDEPKHLRVLREMREICHSIGLSLNVHMRKHHRHANRFFLSLTMHDWSWISAYLKEGIVDLKLGGGSFNFTAN